MDRHEKFALIAERSAILNEQSERAKQQLKEFEANLTTANPGVTACVSLDENNSMLWTKGPSGWGLYFSSTSGAVSGIDNLRRSIKVLAVSKLDDLLDAIIKELTCGSSI